MQQPMVGASNVFLWGRAPAPCAQEPASGQSHLLVPVIRRGRMACAPRNPNHPTPAPPQEAQAPQPLSPLAAKAALRRQQRQQEQLVYQLSAIAASTGITALTVAAVYYKFHFALPHGAPFPWLDMMGTLALTVGGAVSARICLASARRGQRNARRRGAPGCAPPLCTAQQQQQRRRRRQPHACPSLRHRSSAWSCGRAGPTRRCGTTSSRGGRCTSRTTSRAWVPSRWVAAPAARPAPPSAPDGATRPQLHARSRCLWWRGWRSLAGQGACRKPGQPCGSGRGTRRSPVPGAETTRR